MKPTAHNECGKLQSVLIKPVRNAFLRDARIDAEWEMLNYLGRPDLEKAVEEYAVFEQLLRDAGAEVHILPPGENLTMDSLYCRDAAIVTDHGAILCNMGKAARKKEPAA
ncbi:MAG TPA: arginine deiminase-related protein, partial [Flavilitoribacter sp.]|nr:arginine deiminase-related protein [Flavilitoribacter sp.]